MKIFAIILLLLFATGGVVFCMDFKSSAPAEKKYTICRVNLEVDKLQLFLRDGEGKTLKSFDAVERMLQAQNRKLVFAMNAGMYHADYSPVGLFINDGKTLSPLNLNSAEGNFFLKPNGVFFINETGAHVMESSQYPAAAGHATLATQSGPMLVIDGKIHPAFHEDSTSRLFRNGVGIISEKEIVFVISEEPVNFYEFATYFRDVLHCKNALFLDGTISSLYSPELKRNDRKIDLGPIIGVVTGR